MVHHDKPTTLACLRKLVQAIDSHYWEPHMEVSRESGPSNTGNKAEPKSDSSKSDSKSGKGSLNSKSKNTQSGSSQGKGSSSNPKKSATPDLSLKLGKDGKLTPQERQHHMDNKLCLFCGNSGHQAKECPKSTSAMSKAKVSKTDQDKSASTSMDSKKD